MTDLDFRPPPARPAPARLRLEIADQLQQAAQRQPVGGPRQTVRLLLAVAAAVVLVVGVAVVAVQLKNPGPSTGPIGTLDVRRLTDDEAQAQLRNCVAGIAPDSIDGTVLPTDAAAWKIIYARVQHLRGSQPNTSSGVVWAVHDLELARCVDGQFDSATTIEAVPGGRGARTSAIEGSVPALGCAADRQLQDPQAFLFSVAAGVTSARVRLVVDGQPREWQTTGAEGGVVSVPLLDERDFTDLGSAAAVSLELQALDAASHPTPIQVLGHDQPTLTRRTELATCADQTGVGEQPSSVSVADTECARLDHAATYGDQPITVLDRVITEDRYLAIYDYDQAPRLCSLSPVRAIRWVATNEQYDGQSRTEDMAHRLSFSAVDRGADGVVIFSGGILDRTTAAISYRFPDGQQVLAQTFDGYWILSYVTTKPFLDGRPLDGLPPAEVTLTRTDHSTEQYTVHFPAQTTCDKELSIPSQPC